MAEAYNDHRPGFIIRNCAPARLADKSGFAPGLASAVSMQQSGFPFRGYPFEQFRLECPVRLSGHLCR